MAYFLKVGATFGDPAGNANSLAQLFGAGLLVIFWLMYQYKDSKKVYLLVLPGLIFFAFIALIQSRGCILFLSSGLIAIYLLNKKSKASIQFKLLLIPILAIILCFLIFIDQIKELPNIELRLNLLDAGLQILKENWIFGVGDNQLNKMIPEYWRPGTNILSGAGEAEFHLHNEYLQKFVEGGILSLLAFLLIIFFSLKNAILYITNKNDENHKWAAPLIAIFIGFCIQISFDRLLNFPTSALFFYFLAAILISLPNESSKSIKLPSYFPLIISIIYLSLIFPFIKGQYLLLKNTEWSDETSNRLKYYQEMIIPNKNKNEIIASLEKELKILDDNTKSLIFQKLENEESISKETSSSFITILMDHHFNWSKNYDTILRNCDFPDLKVITYKNYLRLLSIENRPDQIQLIAQKMIDDFPSINLPYIIYYQQLINQKKYIDGEMLLKSSQKYSIDPLIKKMILLHQIKYNNQFDFDEMVKCILLRNNLERNPKYAKKYLIQRFEYIHQYYIPFITLALEKGEFKIATKLMSDFYYEYRIKDKQTFDIFKESLKITYPEFIKEFDRLIQS